MRITTTATLVALAANGLFAAAWASDLSLAEGTHAQSPLGSSLSLRLTGGALLPALIAIDQDPGPSLVAGELAPLGQSSSFSVIFTGSSDGAGLFARTLVIPFDLSLIDLDLYLAGLLVDSNDPNQLDISNRVSLRVGAPPSGPVETPLAGKVRGGSPAFDWIHVVPQGEATTVALVPELHAQLVGTQVDLYVTEDRSEAEWNFDPVLLDLTAGGAETVTLQGGGVGANTFVVDAGLLDGNGGDSLGIGYDVVVDTNRNGLLDSGDLIDGYSSGAGFHVVRDPSLAGPHSVVEVTYSGGSFLGQDLFYPSDIGSLTNVPIVVVSHGNGHNYLWYDHIGEHLASYGYVVMSHQNNTVPGVETASTTTLTNTDYLLGNLGTIAGGALSGHVDVHNLMWIGHSRGGEGVVRAYDRITDGTYTPTNFTASDIRIISSIAPTDFLGTNSATPKDKPFHLWVGASDSDVAGCADNNIGQSYHLLGRALGISQGITLYGAGHGDFHNGTGGAFATGPCLVGKANVHRVVRGYVLPLAEFYLSSNQAAFDYLWRHYEDLRPQSTTVGNNCIVVNLQFTDSNAVGKQVIDDFQTQTSTALASSGATVSHDLVEFVETRLDDNNTNFTNNAGDVANGMTYCNTTDFERGAVLSFDPSGGSFLAYDLPPTAGDWSGFDRLSFRACQSTRHPLTTAELSDVQLSVRITDEDGRTATLSSAAVQAGIEEPYQRTSCGTGAGWGNEFESVRLDLDSFRSMEPALRLERIVRLEFLFGASHGSAGARLGLDDIELDVR